MRNFLVFWFVTVLVGCQTTVSDDRPLKVFPEGGEFRAVGVPPAEMARFVAKDFARFQEQGNVHMVYFGSFAVSKSGNAHWWVGGFHSQADADQEAQKKCRSRAKENCTVIGHIVPDGFVDGDFRYLGERGGTAWRRYKDRKGAKAFAVGSKNNWASSSKKRSIEDAEKNALKFCNDKFAITGEPYGGAPCVILDSSE